MAEKNYSIQDVYKSIGENEENLLEWWYDSNNKALGKSPDDFCKEGKQKQLERILMDVLTAAHGG